MVRRSVASAKDFDPFVQYRAVTADFVHRVRRTGTITALKHTSVFAISPCLGEAKATADIIQSLNACR